MAFEIGRRRLIAALGGAAVARPLATRAQQSAMPLVGFLADGTPEGFAPRLTAFKRGLADGGYSEGRNVAIEPRFASHNYDLLPSLADDLVHRQVSAIATIGSEKVTRAAKAATATIPIVAVVAGDPVKRGLVASINHPGGNLTVVSLFTSSDNALVAKRLEILHEVLPKAATVGWLADANILDYDTQLQDMQNAAQALGLKLVIVRVAKDSELEAAFASLVDQGAGAMLEAGPVFYDNRQRLIALAARAKVPMSYEWRTFVAEGGFMSYGGDIDAIHRQAGAYVARVLKGENVGDIHRQPQGRQGNGPDFADHTAWPRRRGDRISLSQRGKGRAQSVAMGQLRHIHGVRAMSASAPKATRSLHWLTDADFTQP
jgi:putative ABC transport system substrate-binding protein